MDSSDFEDPSASLDAEADKQGQAGKPKDAMDKALIVRLVLGALILAACVTFAVQNLDGVETQFLSWSFQLSQFLLMLLSAVAGVVIWELAGAYSRRAKKKRA